MSTRPLECGSCGKDHPSSEECPKPKKRRASWDKYFMEIAEEVSSRATCPRKHVGAVIVRDRTIISTGYNSAIRGAPHCEDIGCMMEDNHCVRVVHAEANAIIQSAKNGVNIDKAAIYTLASPCWPCFKLIANAGILRIIFKEFYRDERIFEAAKNAGIELVHFKEVPYGHESAKEEVGAGWKKE